MRNTLIATVGTSLFMGNLDKLPGNLSIDASLRDDLWSLYVKKNWSALAKRFLTLNPSDRICGAEINTIEEVSNKNYLPQLENLFFLVSDTELGEHTGKFLTSYFEQRKDLKLKQVSFFPIIGLQDSRPKEFKTLGLRNLVREIGQLINRAGGSEYVAMDATGGYKAQIAIAVLMGQALNIPVFYKHERFNEIIDFPPLPVAMDFDVLGKNADLITDLERGNVIEDQNLEEKLHSKMRVFLNEIEVDGKILYELNPIGQLYITSFRLRYPYIPTLVPLADEKRKKPHFRPDHYPNGFKEFVEKVFRDNLFIQSTKSLPYSSNKSIKEIGFKVTQRGDDDFKLVGTYVDENQFGARFEVFLSDNSRNAKNWAADLLNRSYR
jgi:putative CRISPR-associated protein (TIGR02619 family)